MRIGGQREEKSDVALTTEDETSNLLSPLGRCEGVEVGRSGPHRSHRPFLATYKQELSPVIPILSLFLHLLSSPPSPLQPGPTPLPLLPSSRCLPSWISFWITPSPLLVPLSLSTSFFVHYTSSAFLRSAISPVLGMRRYLTFGLQHTFSASNNVEPSIRCSQNTAPSYASVQTK